jgi:predicted P-loop ATPase
VRTYLDALCWDGTERLSDWLITYMGAAASSDDEKKYVRAVGRAWMISAVARVMRPGCKADHMLIFEGDQGVRKSSAIKELVPAKNWFTDEIAEFGTKDAAQSLPGKWLIEVSELEAMRRGEVTRVKAFVSRATDHYRPSYGRRAIDVDRQCVFAGTVNPDDYLADDPGNRRFWPIRITKSEIDRIRQDRDQLWAEAVHAYYSGEKWWLEPDVEMLAGTEQAKRMHSDAWDDRIEHWLIWEPCREQGLDEIKRDRPLDDVSVGEVLHGAIRLEPGKWTRADQMRVASYLKRNKWMRYQRGSEKQWRYKLP